MCGQGSLNKGCGHTFRGVSIQSICKAAGWAIDIYRSIGWATSHSFVKRHHLDVPVWAVGRAVLEVGGWG